MVGKCGYSIYDVVKSLKHHVSHVVVTHVKNVIIKSLEFDLPVN